jgi:hypothetical protein
MDGAGDEWNADGRDGTGWRGRRHRLPWYVDRRQIRGSPEPFLLAEAATYWFLVEGQLDHLAALCERLFARPSNGAVVYRPASSCIVLCFQDVPHYGSLNPPFSLVGTLRTRLALVMALVARVRPAGRGANLSTADHLAWLIPYGFATDMWSVLADREIAGIPVEEGWLEIHPQRAPSRLAVEAMAVERFGWHAWPQRRRLIEVQQVSETGGWPPVRIATPPDIVSALFGGAPDGHLNPELAGVGELVRGSATGPDAPLASLKQFPDVEDGARACYQAIVEVPIQAHYARLMRRLPGQYECITYDYDSHPFYRDLGLERYQPVLQAIGAEMDLVVGPGTTIWEAR